MDGVPRDNAYVYIYIYTYIGMYTQVCINIYIYSYIYICGLWGVGWFGVAGVRSSVLSARHTSHPPIHTERGSLQKFR